MPDDIPENASESCQNPWNDECAATDIVLTIYYNGRRLPICRKCWDEISESNIEWRDSFAYHKRIQRLAKKYPAGSE